MLKIVYKKYSVLFYAFFVTALFSLFVGYTATVYAQCSSQDDCRKELEKLEKELREIQKDITVEDGKQKTISGEIKRLTSTINKTTSEIKKKNSLITNIRGDIVRKEKSLDSLNIRLEKEKESLERILRKRHEIDDSTIFEIVLSSKDISEFYEDVPSFGFVQDSLSDSFAIIDELRVNIYNEKSNLEIKKEQENDAKYSLEAEKNKIVVQKSTRDQALSVSRQKEASFEAIKRQREKEAREIRSKLIQFQGAGIGTRSISFGEAYDYAKSASEETGVRTAFIMAIMQQETGFGRNVGGCNIRNGETGEGIYIKSGNKSIRNMVPSNNNFENFLKITSSLGRDWRTTPISCVAIINGQHYGYGGAMGYTQFIPSTWVSVEARVRSFLGVNVANPWDPEHAVMATGVFLQDLKAQSQTYSAEYTAACRYYGSCSRYAYGDKVLAKAANIQIEIDKLER